jgi:hypothetical protein
MPHPFWSRKGLALVGAFAILACAALLLSVGSTYPEPFPYAAVSADWTCSKTAGILTVCTKAPQSKTGLDHARNAPSCLRAQS